MLSSLKSLREACEPKEEVLSGELRDEMFAANLSDVVSGQAHPVYQDPALFFANTYPTERTASFLREVLGRLAGTDSTASSFFRLDTPFGGGKTHALIALYHLVTSPTSEEWLGRLGIDPALMPADPPKVVSVTCDKDLDPSNGVQKDSVRVHHLWGELAFQLGGAEGYALVEQSDTQGIAPGPQFLDRLIGTQPTLILVDEPAPYMRMMGRAANQLPAFFKTLAEWVTASSSRTVLVLTLAWDAVARQPTAADAFVGETQELVETLEHTFREIQSVINRPARVVTPAQEADIAPILSQRLFRHIDAHTASAVADAYFDMLREAQQRSVGLPASAVRASYRDRIERSYPFHPTLIEVLDGKLATVPNFQRTRGALRLLARVIRRLWKVRGAEGLLIHPFSLDLSDLDLVDELAGRLDRAAFRSVITYDIAHAGGQSHAECIDRERFAGHPPYAQRVATTLLLHSLPEPPARGVDLDELVVATLTPDTDPAHLQKALEYLLDEAWHLDFEGDRYFFRTEASLNKIVLDETQATPLHDARLEVERRIKLLWQDGGLHAKHFPSEPVDLCEELRGRLVILHWDTATFHAGDTIPEKVVELWEYAGTQRGFRRFRNTLFFLVSDSHRCDDMINRARRWVALDRLLRDTRKLDEFKLSSEHRQRLRQWKAEADLHAREAVTRAYCHLFYPFPQTGSPHRSLVHQRLEIEDQGGTTANHTETVLRRLRELGKVKCADDAPLSPALVKRDAFDREESAVPLRTLFERFGERVRLPLLLEPTYFKEIVHLGIRKGDWLYYDEPHNLAYDTDQCLPDIAVDHDHMVMLPGEARMRGVPIYQKESREDGEGNGRGEQGGGGGGGEVLIDAFDTLEAEADPRRALAELAARASSAKWTTLGKVQLTWKADGLDTRSRLAAIQTILGHVPAAQGTVEVDMAIKYPDSSEWSTNFRGRASRYQALASTVETQAREAQDASASIKLELGFPSGLAVDSPEYEDLKETLDLAGLGRTTVVVTRFEGEPT
ncbi:MAG: hypothetical protein DRI40_05795 [Chloroflexi bacterium]|nr:MAG: hypothetical protein DRI40_05795 [Chloroflexota bacterium]